MGQSELEAALRKGGDEKIREIWAAVEAEAAGLRRETADLLGRERQAERARCEQQIRALQTAKNTAAEQRVERCRLEAEAALALRLLSLAKGLLEEFALAGGRRLFLALVAEIPRYSWKLVRVNPRDRKACAGCFPEVEIAQTDKISAGLEVQDAAQQVRIINTLEKRLAHLWPELLPELMAELRQKAGGDGTTG